MQLKLRRVQFGLHRRLSRSGWFVVGCGPFGGCPVQAGGKLINGEFAYFRARGDTATLTISKSPGHEPHHTFSQPVWIDHELGAGVMPISQAVSLIEGWLTEYLGEKPVKQQEKAMGRLTAWWSSLNDLVFAGVQMCFAASGVFRFNISRKVNMFHNGERWIPGVTIQVGQLVLQLSTASNWDE